MGGDGPCGGRSSSVDRGRRTAVAAPPGHRPGRRSTGRTAPVGRGASGESRGRTGGRGSAGPSGEKFAGKGTAKWGRSLGGA
ncbi:hypothetical protein CAC01_25205 [Streptomyces sp. CLI2509]|nr:hypothetical protein CAC01_25205 [Streptomyces sp. CLI2509]